MWIVLIALLIGSFITYSLKEASASKDTCPAAISRSVSKEELYRRKALIDNLLGQKERQLAVLVKTPGKRDLVEVVDGQWPVAVEATYQVLKDPAGRIIFISEFPHSKSGDWEIMYNHYFDHHGRTFAYERQVEACNTFCPADDDSDKFTIEKVTKLYSPEHALVDSTYKLKDEQQLDITQKKCHQDAWAENLVFKNATEYLAHKEIRTAAMKRKKA